ncbi:MAG: SpoIIE family protein phosphatase, partial [Lachnospiraceae bacterium]|nr:SpoIIE family protein phosphatase [Lachnospiraceae bacterium]
MLLLSMALSIGSYMEHGSKVDQYYETTAANLTLMLSRQIDGDFVKELRELVDEEAFQNVREEAVASGDWAPVEGFLDERGMLDEFNQALQSLEQIRQDMNVEYVYVHSIEGPVSVYLVSAPEGISYLGYVGPNAEEFSMYTTNVHIDPGVSNMDGEWVCSAYDPIFDSEGNAVSTVGVDIDMNQVMADRTHFGRRMAIISVCLTLLALAISIYQAQKIAVRPIEELTAGAKNFTEGEKGYSKESVISLDIHSGDEIEVLYAETRTMQEKILDYVENITRITAEKEKISAELNVATEIQASMLPRIFPPFPDRKEFDLFASMDPAKEVGGDFYDFFLVDDDHLALVVAHVSGKGVPAALFMMISKTVLKNTAGT